MTDRLWMLSAPPRNKLVLPKIKQSWCCAESGSTWDCHPQCKWKPLETCSLGWYMVICIAESVPKGRKGRKIALSLLTRVSPVKEIDFLHRIFHQHLRPMERWLIWWLIWWHKRGTRNVLPEELRVDLTLTSSLDSCASVSRPWRRREI